MFQLFGIVERRSMVSGRLPIACLSNVERCEGVDCHEGCEMHSVTRPSENILMEQEVGTKEEQCCFEVDHGRVAIARYDS